MGYSPWGCERGRHNLATKQLQLESQTVRSEVRPFPHLHGESERPEGAGGSAAEVG